MDVNELKKKWVVNISGRLQDNEISLLRKGLNFAITPHTVPMKVDSLLLEPQYATCHEKKEDATRAEVYGALKRAKPLKQRGLANEERRALRELKCRNYRNYISGQTKRTIQLSWREPTTVTRLKKCARSVNVRCHYW